MNRTELFGEELIEMLGEVFVDALNLVAQNEEPTVIEIMEDGRKFKVTIQPA